MFFDEKQSYEISDLGRRIANIIRIGKVKEVDYSLAKARIAMGDILTDWLPWLTSRTGNNQSWHPLDIGEQVIVLAMGGDLSQGVILPALYTSNAPSSNSDIHATHYEDGSMVSFNRATGIYEAIFKSKAIIKAPEIIFEGNVTVAGNLTANGSASLSGGSAAVARVGDEVQVDPKTHKGTIISCSSKATSG